MSRPTEYNRQEILDKVMAMFWKHGAARVTLRTVLEETDFNRHSLYKEFGDMDGLFDAALQNYYSRSAPIWTLLEKEGAGLEAIHGVFEMRRSFDCEKLGCLATNTIVDEHGVYAPALEHAKEYMKRVENGVAVCIENAQREGDVSKDKDPLALAQYVVTVLHGMGPMGKSGASDEALKRVGDLTIESLKK